MFRVYELPKFDQLEEIEGQHTHTQYLAYKLNHGLCYSQLISGY